MNIDSMIQGNPQALVTSYNGVLVADSLQVADSFGKAHKNVIRDIENLIHNIEIASPILGAKTRQRKIALPTLNRKTTLSWQNIRTAGKPIENIFLPATALAFW